MCLQISVHYHGFLFDAEKAGGRGVKFDSSYDKGKPFAFQVGKGKVIQRSQTIYENTLAVG